MSDSAAEPRRPKRGRRSSGRKPASALEERPRGATGAPAGGRSARRARPSGGRLAPRRQPANPAPAKAPPPRKRRRRISPLLLKGLLVLAGGGLLALTGLLAVQITDPEQFTSSAVEAPSVDAAEDDNRLQPEVFHAQEHLELFDPIAERDADPEPMTEEEVFDPAEVLELDGLQLTLQESELSDSCSGAVWGEELAQALADAGCASAAHGVYADGEEDYIGQFTLFDLADADSAQEVTEGLGPGSAPGFVVPVRTDLTGLQEGYSQATVQVMGHYLAIFWVARADGEHPEDDDSLASVNVVAMDAAVAVYHRVRDAGSDADD